MRVLAVQRTTLEHFDLIDGMHCLRSSIFQDRLGWEVRSAQGREYDEFDDLNPTYILAVTSKREVIGSVRILPVTGPTMLETKFPELLDGGSLIAHARMIETSRFCVDTQFAEGRVVGGLLHEATTSLFAGIIEWCLSKGFTEIATATDVRFERILKRAGWPMRRLGSPKMINETNSVAGLLPADRASFERVRPERYHSDFSLSRQHAA